MCIIWWAHNENGTGTSFGKRFDVMSHFKFGSLLMNFKHKFNKFKEWLRCVGSSKSVTLVAFDENRIIEFRKINLIWSAQSNQTVDFFGWISSPHKIVMFVIICQSTACELHIFSGFCCSNISGNSITSISVCKWWNLIDRIDIMILNSFPIGKRKSLFLSCSLFIFSKLYFATSMCKHCQHGPIQ